MFFVVWIVLCILAGMFAQNRGFGFFATFVFSLVLSPLVGFISVLVRKPRNQSAEAPAVNTGQDTKVCPFCAETIKAAATVCRYCGRELPTIPAKAGSDDEKFEEWLRAQSPSILNPSAAQRAEYRAAFDYRRQQGEI